VKIKQIEIIPLQPCHGDTLLHAARKSASFGENENETKTSGSAI
jgi:hypothetical protein